MGEKGKIIVLEGSDGSGKKTQTGLLVERAEKEGYKVATISFPQYEKFFGKEIRSYLNGDFGNLDEVHSKLASLLYALDRLSAKEKLNDLLSRGYNIILNRYLESNICHQSAKLKSGEREEFIKWLYELEIKQLGLPESDIVIYLDLPINFSQQAMSNEGRKKDIHESNIEYLFEVEKIYREMASKNKKWVLIDCLENGKRVSINELNEKIWGIIKKNINK